MCLPFSKTFSNAKCCNEKKSNWLWQKPTVIIHFKGSWSGFICIWHTSSCEENSGLWSLNSEDFTSTSHSSYLCRLPEDPVLITLLPITLTPLSATSPSCFSPLHLWNLSFSFMKAKDSFGKEPAVVFWLHKIPKTNIDHPPGALLLEILGWVEYIRENIIPSGQKRTQDTRFFLIGLNSAELFFSPFV